MDDFGVNFKKNMILKIIVLLAVCTIITGLFLKYVSVGAAGIPVKGIALIKMPSYCWMGFVLAAALMAVGVLSDRIFLSVIGSGIGVIVDVIFAFLCNNKAFVIKLLGKKASIAQKLADGLNSFFGGALDSVIDKTKDAVEITLLIGFYVILAGALLGLVLSIIMLIKEMNEENEQDDEMFSNVHTIQSNSIVNAYRGVLKFVSGEMAQNEIYLNDGDRVMIGRDPKTSNIVLRKDGKISRKHCSISYRNGKFYITDYSSNGIKLSNGNYIIHNKEININNNECVRLSSDTSLVVQVAPRR